MIAVERQAMLERYGLISATCGLCGQENPSSDFDFDHFWAPQGEYGVYFGPVHLVCAKAKWERERPQRDQAYAEKVGW